MSNYILFILIKHIIIYFNNSLLFLRHVSIVIINIENLIVNYIFNKNIIIMGNEYMVSPNSEEIEWLRHKFLITIIDNNAYEFVNILMSWNNAHQALMTLNIIEFKDQLNNFIITQKTFLDVCPNFEYASILQNELIFIEYVIQQ